MYNSIRAHDVVRVERIRNIRTLVFTPWTGIRILLNSQSQSTHSPLSWSAPLISFHADQSLLCSPIFERRRNHSAGQDTTSLLESSQYIPKLAALTYCRKANQSAPLHLLLHRTATAYQSGTYCPTASTIISIATHHVTPLSNLSPSVQSSLQSAFVDNDQKQVLQKFVPNANAHSQEFPRPTIL